MKKFKLLPSVLMLVLCMGVLAVGIYAISPAQNNVTGTISVIASNVEVEITAYSSTNKSTATQISDVVTTRTGTPIEIYNDKLEFNCSSASSSDDVADITIVLQIKNKSASKVLGAFFLKDATLPQTLTTANIASQFDFDGKTSDETETESGLVTALVDGYTEIGAGATIDVICTLSLNKLTDYDMDVDFTLPLVIHDYDSNLVSTNVSLVAKKGTTEDGATAIITTSGNGAYKVEDTVTLTASATDVTSGYKCTYTWYAKNTSGTWEEVGTGATYTFTMSAGSNKEYKVVYSVVQLVAVNITCEVEVTTNNMSVAPTVTVSGIGEYNIGQMVTLTLSVSSGSGYVASYINWYYRNESNSWIEIIFEYDGVYPTIYEFELTETSPAEYKVIFHAVGSSGGGSGGS